MLELQAGTLNNISFEIVQACVSALQMFLFVCLICPDAAPNQFVEMKGTLGSGAGRRRIPVKLLKTSGGAGKVGVRY